MARRGKSRKMRRTGCLFWLFILLIIAVILLYRGKGTFRETINTVISFLNSAVKEETKLKKEKEEEKNKEKPQIPEEKITIVQNELEEKKITENEQTNQTSSKKDKSQEIKEKSLEPTKTEKTLKQVEKKETYKSPAKEIKIKKGIHSSHTRVSTIYFATFNPSTGEVYLTGIKKPVKYIDSPITKTIQALLEGPGESEKEKGIKSFIPKGTKLISASLKENHLVLNFNENFENNYLGRESIEIQLKQILLTCFEFNEVKSISILINGEKKKYITGEGIPLKESYTRSDLDTI